jgi:zinc protease
MTATAARFVKTVTLPNGLPAHQCRLANGLEAWIVENHAAPVFAYQTWFRVGSRDEKLDPRLGRTGLAHLFEHMMFRGTKRYPDGAFDAILAESGAHNQNATTWLDRTNYYESLPRDRLERVMELEADRMANLELHQALLDTERDAVLGELRMGLDDPDTVAYDRLYETAFTTHPYRFSTMGTEAEIRSFTREEAAYFYRTWYSANNVVILIVGDVDPAAAVALIERHYGGFAPQEIPRLPAPAEPPQAAERRVELRHPQLQQPKLLIGYHAPGVRHPDQPALHVLRALLSLGESALLEREWVNAGLAVEVTGHVDQFRDPGLFVLGAEVQEGHAPEELLRRLDLVLSAEPLATPDSPTLAAGVERARNQLLLETYGQWEDTGSLASFMGEYLISAGDPLYGFALVAALDGVTAADVARVREMYLTPRNRSVVLAHAPEELAHAPEELASEDA